MNFKDAKYYKQKTIEILQMLGLTAAMVTIFGLLVIYCV